MAKAKLAKLLIQLNLSLAKPADLVSRGHTVFTNMDAASGLFPSPPVSLTTLKQDVDDLTTSSAAAVEGGKKEKAQREKARKAVEKENRQWKSRQFPEGIGDWRSFSYLVVPPKCKRAKSA